MAFSYTDRVGDGVLKVFTFAFTGVDKAYIRDEDIQVQVDEVPTAYTLVGENAIELAVAPANGIVVRIRRIMPQNVPYSTFSRGNSFGQDNMNFSFQQSLYLQHEFLDGFFPDGWTWNQDVNMGGYKIFNLQDGVNPQDAVTYGQVMPRLDNAYNWASEAEDTTVDDGINPVGYSAFHWSEKAEDSNISASLWNDFAMKWSSEAEDTLVDDGINPTNYSAFHWSKKAEDFLNAKADKIGGDFGAVRVGAGTEAQRPIDTDKALLRFNTEEQQFEGYNLSEAKWTNIGAGGVSPKLIYKATSFTVEDQKAYALEMGDDVTKTVTIPDGLDEGAVFGVKTLNWTGAQGVHLFITTLNEEWEVIGQVTDSTSRSLRVSQNCNVYIEKVNGKWSVIDGIGEGGSGGSGGAIGGIFYENDTHVTESYTITVGKNAMSAGEIIIDNGVTVTVPNGSTWSIV